MEKEKRLEELEDDVFCALGGPGMIMAMLKYLGTGKSYEMLDYIATVHGIYEEVVE